MEFRTCILKFILCGLKKVSSLPHGATCWSGIYIQFVLNLIK